MLRQRPSPSTLAIAVVLVFFLLITWRWSWNEGPAIIRSDARGYYGYLRALFINHDLGHEQPDHTFVHETPVGTLNKYFAGEAVLLSPFFGLAHLYAHLTGHETDGFSRPYEIGIGLAALFYATLGVFLFRAVLQRMVVEERAIAITVLLLGFGTQLVQYVSIQPGWSHVYSFCCISGFLLALQRLHQNLCRRNMVITGLLYGLIVLIRPVNATVLLALPIVLGKDSLSLLSGLRSRPSLLFIGACGVAAVVSIQALLWYAQVGSFIADGYRGEGFYWSRPEFVKVLFSVRRGLFVWAPVLFIAALSVVSLFKRDRWRASALLLYWLVNTYVISCWWIWYYGSGWGQRVFVDHYAVLLLPLALQLGSLTGGLRKATVALLALLSLFTMAQFYQYGHDLLDVEGMDRKKYAFAFLRFDDAHRNRMGGMFRVPPFCPNGLDTLYHERWTSPGSAAHWGVADQLLAVDGSQVRVSSSTEFGPQFVLRPGEFPVGRELYIALGFERKAVAAGSTAGILAVATLESAPGKASFYQTFVMDPLPPEPDTWEHIEYRVPYPAAAAGEAIAFYFWNKDLAPGFVIKDLDITVMAVRPY